jgi:hypothetical protein
MAEDLVISVVSRVSKPPFGESEIVEERYRDYSPLPAILAKCRFSFCFPESITYLTPGIVMDVSAILVARIHLRESGGVGRKTLVCCALGSDAYSEHMITSGTSWGS